MTLVEYADLQCPYCAQWSRETLPVLVDEYVATGKLRIVFHGLAFIGADSDKALRTAIAAGQDDHLWDVVHGLYASQGAENSGWVTRRARRRDRRRSSRARRREPPLRALGELGRSRAEARGRRGHARRRARHAGLPDRTDRRSARAPRGQLARPRWHHPGDRGARWPDERAHARLASAVVAVLGAAISAYLLYVRQTGGALVCSTGGCETVQSSTYAEVLGVPVAALGLAGFLGLLVTALARGEWARLSQATLALTALGFSDLPSLHPARRHRRDLPVVPRDRSAHARDRRSGAPPPAARRRRPRVT